MIKIRAMKKIMMLFVIGVLANMAFAQAPTAEQIQALKDARDYAYNQHYQATTYERMEKDPITRVFEFNPALAKKAQLQLLTVDGQPATKKQIADFSDDFYERKEQGKDGIHPDLADLTLLRQEGDLLFYQAGVMFYQKGKLNRKDGKNFTATLIFDVQKQHFVEYRAQNISTFSPKFMVKVDNMLAIEHYELAHGRLVVRDADVQFDVSAFGMEFAGQFSSQIEYVADVAKQANQTANSN